MRRAPHNLSSLTLRQFVDWGKASCRLSGPALRQAVRGVSNDSRIVGKGEVFVALTTEKDDGHRYVSGALKRGAAAAIVANRNLSRFSEAERKKLIPVDDPLKALQRIAAQYRKTLGLPIVGITGSSGKTTARTFVAGVLKQGLRVGETSGNLNNHIGVPMSLLKFTGKEDVGVLEMGANHEREIHLLSTIVRPTVGVITSIGYAHIGYFGSLANILRAKLEIVDGMDDPSGFLLLNGDDRLLASAAKRLKKETVFFGFSSRCAIRARNVRIVGGRATCFEANGARYRIGAVGRHFVYSALLAIYLGKHFGVDERRIASALRSMRPAHLRGSIERASGATFIIDCYNANPSSMKSGIELLGDVAGGRRTVAVVGDMLELGKYSRRLHYELGKLLARAGVRSIVAIGDFAPMVAKGSLAAGMRGKDVITAPDSLQAIAAVKETVRRGDVVLLKGSRNVHLETIYDGIKKQGTRPHAFTI
jgi:UDP-N-acetylmuramoyl-tripeptide--D-alanyl-D-alanine ligase